MSTEITVNKLSLSLFVAAASLLSCDSALAGEDATHCVEVLHGPNGGRSFKNTCGYAIEIAWCYEGRDCRNGSWGYGNTWSFQPGSVRPASTFSNNLAGTALHFAACKDANSSIQELDAHRHICR